MHCDATCATEWFFMIFSSVTLPIYILSILTLIKYHKNLKSSFYTLVISTGFADVWLTIHKFTFATIPRTFFREQILYNNTFATVSKVGLWYIYFAQVLGVWFMTANRYSALATPLKYKQIWTNKAVAIAILLQWTLPTPTMIPQFFPCCGSSFKESNETLYPNFVDKTVNKIYFTIDIILEPGFFACTIVGMYILIFYKALQFSKREAKSTNKKDHRSMKAELRLAMIGVIISGLYVVLCCCYICIYLNYTPSIVTLTFYYASDLFTGINPWALLAFCGSFRKYFVGFLLCREPSHIQSRIAASSTRKTRGSAQVAPSSAPKELKEKY